MHALGDFADNKRAKLLHKEIDTYNDFIIGDFVDSYDNLTYKTMTAYT